MSYLSPVFFLSLVFLFILQVVQEMMTDCDSSLDIERACHYQMLVVLLLYTAFPPGRGREYREMVLKMSNVPPKGLLERANVFHHNTIAHDRGRLQDVRIQVVDCPSRSMFIQIVRDYVDKYRQQLQTVGQSESHLILVNWNDYYKM